MTPADVASVILVAAGALFFAAGTLGLLRLPDIYTRLHALTKADNLGLGLVAAGVAFQVESGFDMAKLFFTWLLVMLAGSSVAHLVARSALDRGVRWWRR